ncbi:UPF0158 family protein [Synechococcus sp. PCC 6312]|uniref:UPF0158 family protein n=1 Tax=Synechococcus sp. (strain ATCC 27167 / PCC 6312) TaxID=195253 RepID=UPI00029F3DFB|nr:UPF0158 family protein [Synechococcus sp. PCC 6312]AFY61836.1 Uncharacterized protein family (UPF0158) [Synechococcus sp. PCC 6312]
MATIKKEDLELISTILNSSEIDGAIGSIFKRTGHVSISGKDYAIDDPDAPVGTIEEQEEAEEFFDLHFVSIPNLGSKRAYQNMLDFTHTVEYPKLKSDLLHALSQARPFSKFEAVLMEVGSEFERWRKYEEEARLKHAKEWVEEKGFTVEV